jgi:hypothetical protein
MASTSSKLIKAPDLKRILQPSHAGQWVTFSHDYSKVIASADSVETLLKKLSKEEKDSDPIFYKVPLKESYYTPAIQ